jgi:hypothetical protein
MKNIKNSKKTVLVGLCCVIVGILMSIGKSLYKYHAKEAISSSNLTEEFLHSLKQSSTDYIIFTIGHCDCSICKDISNDLVNRKLNALCYYFDVTKHAHNQLLSQALCTKYFPTTYILDNRMNLMGIVLGNRDREKKILKTCFTRTNHARIKIEDVGEEQVMQLLSYSLHALFCGIKKEVDSLEKYARKSLEKGDYFFNNYLMFRVFTKKQDQDSIRKYREKTLQYAKYGNRILYKDLIDSLNMR